MDSGRTIRGLRSENPCARPAAATCLLIAGLAALLTSCTATTPADRSATATVVANGATAVSTTGAPGPVMPLGSSCAPGNATAAASGVVPTSYMAPVPPEMPIPAPPNALLGEGAFSTRNLTANAPEQPQLIAAAEPGPQLSPLTISMLTTPTNGQPAEQAVAGVLQYTVEHHPLLRVRQAEIEAARAKIVTARLLPNPELTVDTLDSPSESGPPEISTRLMFTLPLGPKRELRAAAAETGVCVAQLAMSRDTKVILAEAADAAIEVLYLQELLVVYGQLSGLAQQVSNIEQERFNVAAVPYRSVVLTQLAASRLELLQQDTAAQLDQAKVRLARAVGAADGSPPSIGGKLAVQPISFVPVATMQARVRQVAPEMAESRTATEKSREELSLERWNALPDLKIGPRYRSDLGNETDDRWGARVQLDLPVFDRNQGHIAEGAAMVRTNRAKQDLVEVFTVADATSLYMELQDVQTRADYYSTQVRPLTERTEKALREAFQDQLVSAYELTELLDSMARMELRDVELRHEHQRLRMRLELLLESRLPPAPPAKPPKPVAANNPAAPSPSGASASDAARF